MSPFITHSEYNKGLAANLLQNHLLLLGGSSKMLLQGIVVGLGGPVELLFLLLIKQVKMDMTWGVAFK